MTNGSEKQDRVWTGEIRREYKLKRLAREDLEEDPILQFRVWFEEGKPTLLEPNAMAFATADPRGQPSIRMVLMKSFDHSGIVFATNYKSRKGQEIDLNPQGAILFYWPSLERQLRVVGKMEQTSSVESDEIFQTRHPKSRIGAIASRQSQPIESREALELAFFEEERQWPDENIQRPEFWGGYRLIPAEFEFWQGGEHRLHDRFVYRLMDDAWEIIRLQP